MVAQVDGRRSAQTDLVGAVVVDPAEVARVERQPQIKDTTAELVTTVTLTEVAAAVVRVLLAWLVLRLETVAVGWQAR